MLAMLVVVAEALMLVTFGREVPLAVLEVVVGVFEVAISTLLFSAMVVVAGLVAAAVDALGCVGHVCFVVVVVRVLVVGMLVVVGVVVTAEVVVGKAVVVDGVVGVIAVVDKSAFTNMKIKLPKLFGGASSSAQRR